MKWRIVACEFLLAIEQPATSMQKKRQYVLYHANMYRQPALDDEDEVYNKVLQKNWHRLSFSSGKARLLLIVCKG